MPHIINDRIQEKSFLYMTPDSKNYKNIPVVTLHRPKFFAISGSKKDILLYTMIGSLSVVTIQIKYTNPLTTQ